ncbi:MAG TPA: hypothetical protein VNU66_04490 [Mycobacteriales bacterium]|nr:hypothetical protein [Mycobacteriales bacterium]
MRFEREGIALEVPPGWQASLHRRPEWAEGAVVTAAQRADRAPGATVHPVLHVGSFRLPPDRGDYGSGAVDEMGPADVLVCLVEFHPDAAREPLFAAPLPRAVTSDLFGAESLQRVIEGQSGYQRFFSHQGRAFCLYVVLGSHARRHLLVGQVNALLESLEIAGEPAS